MKGDSFSLRLAGLSKVTSLPPGGVESGGISNHEKRQHSKGAVKKLIRRDSIRI